tara:strand:- start:217 stop:426 length:210 start_codon:yes stop_codon:yes gene_type:complete
MRSIKIEINEEETLALVEGETVETPIKQVHEFDYGPFELTHLELEDGREFESQDDCQTWEDLACPWSHY